MTKRIGMLGALLACFVGAAAAIDMVGQTVTGFRVPDYDENNNLKTLLLGDFAKVLPDGVIEITGLRIEVYQQGKVAMVVTAPHCRFHQKEGKAQSDGDVQVANEDMVVTGKGFEWTNQEEVFKIHSQTHVVLRNVRRAVGAEEGEGE
jgi:hypothetical protein